ncbi:hypothetical protein [Rodentibacter genomosp. 2]|uniref:Hyaluronidase n=1 Tax=Rodentibacter genomosp. 2 TaxID=1908266 RepID=A0A1V3JI11_9PAST|nr:hypothetical protein [Rodentibacter genomosp. 2]OOF56400.1 hypothetical protein BKK55_06160 [Rodentibacter genomosp. 2]
MQKFCLRTMIPVLMLFLSNEVLAKNFVIYDRMDYIGKPDLSSDKLSKVFLVYESELVKPDPTGKRKHGVLNLEKIRHLARQSHLEGYRMISTDIESWFSDKEGQLLTPEELDADFKRLFSIFKEENPKAFICNYGLPMENLSVIRFFRPASPYDVVLSKWREFSKRRQKATANCDYLNPVLYIADPNVKNWEYDVKMTVEDIRRRFPNKPLIGYLWPQYYSASGSPHFKQFIDAKTWRQMLEISYKYMDGIIIWSDKRDDKNELVKWTDPRVQAIMKETKSFISSQENSIQVER